MKKTYSHLYEPDLSPQLEAAGILTGNAQDAAITHAAPPGLLIRQVGGIVENSAFDLDCGYGTGFILSLHVAVDRPVFRISEWGLDVPWEDPLFEWLPEPQGSKFPRNLYQVPHSYLEYPRDEVINHRRVLKRGNGLDGLLLGWSAQPIPDSYRHGAIIDASLVLLDEMGRGFPTLVNLWVNRIAKIDRKPAKSKTREPIFENQDWFEDELVEK